MRTLWLALLLIGCADQPKIAPDGIVSNNPCIDAVLAEIATPGQIAAVSDLSHRAASASAPLAWARKLPAIGASAEEIIRTKPRLVLTGSLKGTPTTDALVRAGIDVRAFPVAATIAESVMQVRQVSTAIDRRRNGEALAIRIEQASRPSSPRNKSAIIWLSGGFVPGKGSLQDELIERAGYRNASTTYGLGQWQQLPLEILVNNPPDAIFANQNHPVFARLKATRIIPFPDQLSFCAGPSIITTLKLLRA